MTSRCSRRPGGDFAIPGDVAVVGRGFGQHHFHGTQRHMDHSEHGHGWVVDRSGSEVRHQSVGVPAGADGHAGGQHGGGSRNSATHGGQSRGDCVALFPASAALAASTCT